MKALKIVVHLIAGSILLLPGCKEITKSIDDTLRPGETVVKRHAQKYGSSTTSSATSTTRVESRQVIVNGDTLNTKEMEDKSKIFFEDLETLKKKW